MEKISVLSVDKKNKSIELLIRDFTLTFKHNNEGRLFYNMRLESPSCDPSDMRLSNKILAAAYRIAAEEFKKITVH